MCLTKDDVKSLTDDMRGKDYINNLCDNPNGSN
jgi:hypothetical protein